MTDYPSFRLDGKTAFVTGAARGLGRAISLALADAGADVALGLRVGTDAEDLAARDRGHGSAGAARADGPARPRPDRARRWRPCRSELGRIDILVNNAGNGPEEAAAEDWTEADFDATFDSTSRASSSPVRP